jgi:hypothetical protein
MFSVCESCWWCHVSVSVHLLRGGRRRVRLLTGLDSLTLVVLLNAHCSSQPKQPPSIVYSRTHEVYCAAGVIQQSCLSNASSSRQRCWHPPAALPHEPVWSCPVSGLSWSPRCLCHITAGHVLVHTSPKHICIVSRNLNRACRPPYRTC